jgi:hypothetical protein
VPLHWQQLFLHAFFLHCFFHALALAARQVHALTTGAGAGGETAHVPLHWQQFFLHAFFLHCFFHALALAARQVQVPDATASPAARSTSSR